MELREFKSYLKDVGGNEGDVCNYNVRLDTFGCGCAHNCSYCYARSLLDFRGLWHPEKPKVADINKIKQQINGFKRGQIIRMGGMTDCFQPLEKYARVSYQAIKYMNSRGVGQLIVTKSPLIAEPEYLQILHPQLAHIQFTITSTDNNVLKDIEQGARPFEERVAAIEKLQAAGFDVQIRLSPYIPQLVDVEKIKAIKCDKMLIEFLRVNSWIKKWLGNYINPEDYSRTFHGYDHLPFEVKREAVKAFEGSKRVTVCDFEPEYLDYWKKEYNPNPKDCCDLRR